jgi:transcriptional regulator with PAS, ATPase and Fis domain
MNAAHYVLRSRRDTLVLSTLRAWRGNRRRTATALGVSVRTLLYWLGDMRDRGVTVPPRHEEAA